MEKEYPHNAHPIHRRPDQRRYSKYYDPDDENPTSAETLPWRREQLNLAEELTKQMNNGNNTSRFSNDYKKKSNYIGRQVLSKASELILWMGKVITLSEDLSGCSNELIWNSSTVKILITCFGRPTDHRPILCIMTPKPIHISNQVQIVPRPSPHRYDSRHYVYRLLLRILKE